MPITPITPLPEPPSRKVPITFSALTDDFLAALPDFVTEANAMAAEIQAAADYVATAGVGPVGPEGPPGPQGPAGADGAQGPKGDTGAGLNILGSYASYSALVTAHPTSTDGTAYLVGTDLYIWYSAAWNNVGPIQGAQGVQGPQGIKGDTGDTGPQGLQGIKGDTGKGITSIARTTGTGAAGTTDTYTITYSDTSTSTFSVYNGADGMGAGDMLKSVYDPNGDGIIAFEQLSGVAAALGTNDNYVTDAEKAALHSHSNKVALDAVSGINTGDQDLSGYATTSALSSGLSDKQNTLVSGINIKTVNGQSLVGSGGITVTGGVSASSISTNTTAVKDTRYVCDTSAGAFTLTLPAAPSVGDYIEVVDSGGTFVTNNLIIGRNNLNINGLAEDLVLNVSNIFVTFTYGDVARGWQVDIGGSTLVSTPADGSVTFEKLSFDGGRTPYAFFKSDTTSVAFTKTAAATLSIKAGTFCLVGTSNTMVSWSTQTAITMPSHTIGTDYYIYACADGSIRADANASAPTGYDTSNSRKIGGYHYGRVRNTLTVTDIATEIVPRSLWDLTYRPKCNPAGMVDVHGNGSLWADIYLAAVDSAITLTSGVVTAGTCKSIYNGTPLSGTEGLHGYNFIELAKNSGKRLLTHSEWLAVAHGSPQGNDGDNLNAWSATTNSARTGTGQVARAVSFCGATDCVGNLWEWLDEWSNDYSTAVAANWYNPMTGQNVGQQYLYNSTGLRMYLAGGSWSSGVIAGSRALSVGAYPWYVNTLLGSRFACDGL